MKIHILQTGSSKLKRSFINGKVKSIFRKLNIIFDKHLDADCPYFNYLIEHPEGLILIDTGESVHSLKREYYTFLSWNFIKNVSKISIKREDEIDYQLKKIGYAPEDVKKVIITHLHQDHIGGLKYFPNAEIFVSKKDYLSAYKMGASISGYIRKMWPKNFAPKLIEFLKDKYLPFNESYFFTEAKDVIIVPTYGHSSGNISVILKDKQKNFLFCGDSTFREELFLKEKVDGVCSDYKKSKDSINKMQEFCKINPTILLPSHDPGAKNRLIKKKTVYSNLKNQWGDLTAIQHCNYSLYSLRN